jgi:hypothetical protein
MLHGKISFGEKLVSPFPSFFVYHQYLHQSTSIRIPKYQANVGIHCGIKIDLRVRTDHIFVTVSLQKDPLFVSRRVPFFAHQ